MFKKSLALAVTVALLLAPVSSLAAVAAATTQDGPPSVTGIKATFSQGKINVSWDASSDPTVAYYRVYFSRASILQNAGRYDDFEATAGKDTNYTLANFPQAPVLYIGVMAVNAMAQESAVFTEEVKVDLTKDGSTGQTMSPPPASSAAASVVSDSSVASVTSSSAVSSVAIPKSFDLVAAEAISATGVLVTFSLPVKLNSADARQALSIVDASGAALAMTKLIIKGSQITIWTLPQQREMHYTVTASPVIKAALNLPAANLPPLNPVHSTAVFTGHETGLTAEQAAAQMPPVLVPDVLLLNLRGEAQVNGTYTVIAEWRPASAVNDVLSYNLRQSLDGGTTFGDVQSVNPDVNSVRFTGVPPSMFALSLQVAGKNGQLSRGTLGKVNLPAFDVNTGSVTPTPAPTPTPGTGGKLPQSGMSELLVGLLAGCIAGYVDMRRRTALRSH